MRSRWPRTRVHHAPPAQPRRTGKGGVSEGMVRLSVGIEHIDDLLATYRMHWIKCDDLPMLEDLSMTPPLIH